MVLTFQYIKFICLVKIQILKKQQSRKLQDTLQSQIKMSILPKINDHRYFEAIQQELIDSPKYNQHSKNKNSPFKQTSQIIRTRKSLNISKSPSTLKKQKSSQILRKKSATIPTKRPSSNKLKAQFLTQRQIYMPELTDPLKYLKQMKSKVSKKIVKLEMNEQLKIQQYLKRNKQTQNVRQNTRPVSNQKIKSSAMNQQTSLNLYHTFQVKSPSEILRSKNFLYPNQSQFPQKMQTLLLKKTQLDKKLLVQSNSFNKQRFNSSFLRDKNIQLKQQAQQQQDLLRHNLKSDVLKYFSERKQKNQMQQNKLIINKMKALKHLQAQMLQQITKKNQRREKQINYTLQGQKENELKQNYNLNKADLTKADIIEKVQNSIKIQKQNHKDQKSLQGQNFQQKTPIKQQADEVKKQIEKNLQQKSGINQNKAKEKIKQKKFVFQKFVEVLLFKIEKMIIFQQIQSKKKFFELISKALLQIKTLQNESIKRIQEKNHSEEKNNTKQKNQSEEKTNEKNYSEGKNSTQEKNHSRKKDYQLKQKEDKNSIYKKQQYSKQQNQTFEKYLNLKEYINSECCFLIIQENEIQKFIDKFFQKIPEEILPMMPYTEKQLTGILKNYNQLQNKIDLFSCYSIGWFQKSTKKYVLIGSIECIDLIAKKYGQTSIELVYVLNLDQSVQKKYIAKKINFFEKIGKVKQKKLTQQNLYSIKFIIQIPKRIVPKNFVLPGDLLIIQAHVQINPQNNILNKKSKPQYNNEKQMLNYQSRHAFYNLLGLCSIKYFQKDQIQKIKELKNVSPQMKNFIEKMKNLEQKYIQNQLKNSISLQTISQKCIKIDVNNQTKPSEGLIQNIIHNSELKLCSMYFPLNFSHIQLGTHQFFKLKVMQIKAQKNQKIYASSSEALKNSKKQQKIKILIIQAEKKEIFSTSSLDLYLQKAIKQVNNACTKQKSKQDEINLYFPAFNVEQEICSTFPFFQNINQSQNQKSKANQSKKFDQKLKYKFRYQAKIDSRLFFSSIVSTKSLELQTFQMIKIDQNDLTKGFALAVCKCNDMDMIDEVFIGFFVGAQNLVQKSQSFYKVRKLSQ